MVSFRRVRRSRWFSALRTAGAVAAPGLVLVAVVGPLFTIALLALGARC